MSIETNSNQPAYPHCDFGDIGVTKREYFAAMAMQGLLANPAYADYSTESKASSAVACADALLKELEK
jgi:hypothetical protein